MKRKGIRKMVGSAVAFLLVSALAGPVMAQDARESVLEKIEGMKADLLQMNEWLYKNPEPGHKETKAVEMLTGYLKQKGWQVEVGLNKIADFWEPILEKAWKMKTLPTVFKATYPGQEGGPTIAFLVEYDALRGPGGRPSTAASTTCRARSGSGLLWPSQRS